MRIYFNFSLVRQAALCHEVARYWQETRDWCEFAGMVVAGSHCDFLRTQTAVIYQYLDVIDEIYKEALNYQISRERLTEWEKRLDCPLWHLVVADRDIGYMFVRGGLFRRTDLMDVATHDNIMRFVGCCLDLFERRLETFQPDAVFFPVMASLPPLALAKVCQWLEIPFFRLHHTRVLDRHIISRNAPTERFCAVEGRFQELLANPTYKPQLPEEAKRYFETFQEARPERPGYSVYNAQLKQRDRQEGWLLSWARIGYWFLRALYGWWKRLRRPDRYMRSEQPFSVWWVASREKLAVKRQRTPYAEPPRIGQEPYVLFPLHLDPEASTMILAPNFVNQLAIIEALAKNIPMTHKLYVKEHPTMLGRRPRGFYEEIKRFPNVRLMSAGEDNFQLIRHADLVTVITGTAGWEAIMMGRPVITFGDCFYADLGFSERCADFNQLGHQVRRLLFESNHIDQTARQERLLLFLTALFEHSFPLSTRILWPKKPFLPGQLPEEALLVARTIADHLAEAIEADSAVTQNITPGFGCAR